MQLFARPAETRQQADDTTLAGHYWPTSSPGARPPALDDDGLVITFPRPFSVFRVRDPTVARSRRGNAAPLPAVWVRIPRGVRVPL